MSKVLPGDDFTRYVDLRREGVEPTEAYQIGKANGLREIELLRMLRYVYDISLGQAKETMVVANGSASLDAYEQSLVEFVKESLSAPSSNED